MVSLEHLQESLSRLGSGANERELAWSFDTFLAQRFSQMVVLFSRIRSVLTSHMQGRAEAPTDVCRMMQCPRLSTYREALDGTVEVLAKTKNSFRSKELGLLRAKIEQLFREEA